MGVLFWLCCASAGALPDMQFVILERESRSRCNHPWAHASSDEAPHLEYSPLCNRILTTEYLSPKHVPSLKPYAQIDTSLKTLQCCINLNTCPKQSAVHHYHRPLRHSTIYRCQAKTFNARPSLMLVPLSYCDPVAKDIQIYVSHLHQKGSLLLLIPCKRPSANLQDSDGEAA